MKKLLMGSHTWQCSYSLNNHTYMCNASQLTGIPCKHGMRAVLLAGLEPTSFVHEWYSVKKYKVAYGQGIYSIPNKDQWPESNMPAVEPPPLQRGVGRLCRNRKRREDEERKGKRSSTIKCTICKEFGHNKLTCRGGITNKQKKAAEGSGTSATN